MKQFGPARAAGENSDKLRWPDERERERRRREALELVRQRFKGEKVNAEATP
jgi:hypothetical protein